MKSGHVLKKGKVVCQEAEAALCRVDWRCECEELYGLENVDGTWIHYVNYGETPHPSQGVTAPEHCNLATWIDACGVWDMFIEQDDPAYAGLAWHPELLPDGAIDVEWDGDEYVWNYADPETIGALIGRAAGARLADAVDVEIEVG